MTDAFLPTLVGFGRFLRASGLPVGTGRILTFCRAVATLEPLAPGDVRLAARATLASHPDHLAMLDRLFDQYFTEGTGRDVTTPSPEASREPRDPAYHPTEAAGPEVVTAAQWRSAESKEELEGEAAIRIVASEAEILRAKDFAELTEEERRAVAELIRRLVPHLPVRHSRRLRPTATGRRFDLRRTLRRSLKTEGEPLQLAWQARRTRRRPLVLILDVSGSMAPYSRPLMEFAHAATFTGGRVEVFCFGTRLTRITRALRARDPRDAMASVARAVEDWEGGTRIGASLKELLDEWATRSALRGSTVVVCSDGLERGEPQVLAAQMGRLSRLAHSVVWVNPLKGSPRYEPLARGMAASLPYVNVFLPGHNLESMEALAAVLRDV